MCPTVVARRKVFHALNSSPLTSSAAQSRIPVSSSALTSTVSHYEYEVSGSPRKRRTVRHFINGLQSALCIFITHSADNYRSPVLSAKPQPVRINAVTLFLFFYPRCGWYMKSVNGILGSARCGCGNSTACVTLTRVPFWKLSPQQLEIILFHRDRDIEQVNWNIWPTIDQLRGLVVHSPHNYLHMQTSIGISP